MIPARQPRHRRREHRRGRHPAAEGDAAVLRVFGAGGGLGGPAGGLYPRLAQRLRARGVLSVEVASRQPARMAPCVADLLAGLDWLAG
jgi:hypothetical protein